jgi:hypothetical protein
VTGHGQNGNCLHGIVGDSCRRTSGFFMLSGERGVLPACQIQKKTHWQFSKQWWTSCVFGSVVAAGCTYFDRDGMIEVVILLLLRLVDGGSETLSAIDAQREELEGNRQHPPSLLKV